MNVSILNKNIYVINFLVSGSMQDSKELKSVIIKKRMWHIDYSKTLYHQNIGF